MRYIASMRPRLLHLGYRTYIRIYNTIIKSFNEAEAFTPRIYMRNVALHPVLLGFNEAEAFTPRISACFDPAESGAVKLQ